MDGNSSVMLGMTPGCHGEHARNYIRRVQVNKEEQLGKLYKDINPKMVTESVWSNNNSDYCISFPISVKDEVILKNELYGINQLEVIRNLYENWILEGMVDKTSTITNNVSNTTIVPSDEWNTVKQYIWNNKSAFGGLSFLPQSGDLDFNQPPYTEVLMPDELLDQYGEGIMFASGLIVHAEEIFGDLWKACDTYLGKNEKLYATYNDVDKFIESRNLLHNLDLDTISVYKYNKLKVKQYRSDYELLELLGYSEETAEALLENDIEISRSDVKRYLDGIMFDNVHKLFDKRDIIRRFDKFADKYFNGDSNLMLSALKHVQLYHDWCNITKTHKDIDWTGIKWENKLLNADELGAIACAGGACEII